MLVISILSVYLAIVGGVVAANRVFQPKEKEDDEEQLSVLDKMQLFNTKEKMNVLILGTDGSKVRSDTIILASLDPKNKQLNMLSIPRDTKVNINGADHKINAALALGKEELAIRKVKELTGMPIHYYVVVDFEGFRNIIDILGGVDLDVPVNMDYDDPVQNLHIHLKKGMQHLDGDKAEQFVRYRQYPEGDLGRIKAQQQFIKALLEQKLKVEYLSKADDIFKEVQKNVRTNISIKDMTKGLAAIKALQSGNINMYQLPGEPKMIRGISYFIADDEKITELVEEGFGYSISRE
ncbi:MAG: LCP family protein [Clostridiaceae bacterium]|nr:LCP family protein [Clostridiaceae bacterium]